MLQVPSYEKCLEISKLSNHKFYENKFIIDDFQISIFNYRHLTYQDFVDFDGFELRGLTFVFNIDGSLYKRFVMLEKFFNFNENESSSLDSIKSKKIKSVYLKEDGSMIGFIELPNGKILARTKNSFDSSQALHAQDLFDKNPKINSFVKRCISENLSPIFELVGPKNRVVVKYDIHSLILLKVRDNSTGKYLDINDFDIDKPAKFKFSLEDLITLRKELVGMEGWIVEFIDGQKIKIKTDWYLSLHRIFTDYSQREDYLIDLILEDKIDDVLSVLDLDSEARNFVEEVIDKTNKKILKLHNDVDELLSEFDGDRKSFAIKHKNNESFPVAIMIISGKDKSEVINDFIKKKTHKLCDAKNWLESIN